MKYAVHRIKEYVKYYLRARTIYDVHSPFLFDLLNFTFDTDRNYYDFEKLDGIRRLQFLNDDVIDDYDPGAGSTVNPDSLKVHEVANSAMSSQKHCEWLYRLARYLQPEVVLELGSSLGISALYLGAGLDEGRVITLEGRSSIAYIAQQNLENISINNVKLIPGLFENTLPDLISNLDTISFVVLDGNHRYEPTMKYANQILQKHRPMGILVDDIYWSPEMTQAWRELKKLQQFNLALDFFDFGLLLNRPEIESKIDISLIEYHKKLWRFGLFG